MKGYIQGNAKNVPLPVISWSAPCTYVGCIATPTCSDSNSYLFTNGGTFLSTIECETNQKLFSHWPGGQVPYCACTYYGTLTNTYTVTMTSGKTTYTFYLGTCPTASESLALGYNTTVTGGSLARRLL
jgi:hypothetical protein